VLHRASKRNNIIKRRGTEFLPKPLEWETATAYRPGRGAVTAAIDRMNPIFASFPAWDFPEATGGASIE
jgi:hypothetical protein